MKKIAITILAVFYLITTSGATLHFHYCMGNLVEWTLGHNNSDKCGKCGMPKDKYSNNGCCKDETTLFKVDKDQKQSTTLSTLISPFTEITPSLISYFFISLPDVGIMTLSSNHSPPGSCKTPLHIINCLFRI